MSSNDYADFELFIGNTPTPGEPAALRDVRVTSPARPGVGNFTLDTKAEAFRNLISAAKADAPALDLRKQAGKELFAQLFRDQQVRTCWDTSLGLLNAGNFACLRVRLWIEDPALAALPWELLFTDERFLVTDARFTFSRYLPGPEPMYIDPVPKLRVLGVISRPTSGHNFPKIPDSAVTSLKGMFDKRPAVVYTQLHNPDLATVQKELAKGHHVLHYLGHGVANKLIFTQPDGTAQPIAVENLRQVMIGRRTLRAVVLNACNSAQVGFEDVFGGVGPGIVQVGVPAAVAMQYSHVFIDTAFDFNKTFYDRLTSGKPIDVCVTEARQAVSATDVADRGWSTPVLYVGTRGGRVIEVATGGVSVSDPLTRLGQLASDVNDAKTAFDEIKKKLQETGRRLTSLENLVTIGSLTRRVATQASPLFPFARSTSQLLPNEGWQIVQTVWRGVAQGPFSDLADSLQGQPGELATPWDKLRGAAEVLAEAIASDARNDIPPALGDFRTSLEQFDRRLSAMLTDSLRQTMEVVRTTLGKFAEGGAT